MVETWQAVKEPRAGLRGRDLVTIRDLDAHEMRTVLSFATELKQRSEEGDRPPLLAGKVLALLFEKPSLRTHVTFETAMFHLGGHGLYLDTLGVGMGTRESYPDIGRNLERWVDGVAVRTFAHANVTTLAAHARVPVINALSDWEHPCQALAALLTIEERCGRLNGVQIAWIGDGNNVLRSLLLGAVRLGVSLAIATPPGYELDPQTIETARRSATAGASVEVTDDPVRAVRDADLVYTDVWASMGQEAEAEVRRRTFARYQVNAALLAHAPRHALVSHCLPAHRGDEITDEVLDGPRAVAFDEAENRLHVQKSLLALAL
ncbi:MAG TPA: ornithine carbamoyltransferase [bacterium]|nr:ornithine carbamoyltransferase [bacterium]